MPRPHPGRAIFTHSRDRKAVTDKCRLGCGAVEHQLHMITCQYVAPYWSAVWSLLHAIGCSHPPPIDQGVVLNRWGADKLGTPVECAILRHAYGCLYRDLSLVDTLNMKFVYQRTFLSMVTNFRNAVMRYGERIRRFHAMRCFSGKKCKLSAHAREEHACVITISDESDSYTISPALITAVANADAAVKALHPAP